MDWEATGTGDDEGRRSEGDAASVRTRLGLKRLAREFRCSRNTVRRYVAADSWTGERFFRHRGNARGGATGPAAGAIDRREPARGRAVPPAEGSRSQGDAAVRDATGAATPADRLRAVAGANRGPAGAPLPVRGDAGLFPSWRSRISARRLSSAGWKAPTRCWVDNPRALVGNHDTATRRGRVQRPVLAFAGH